MKFKPGDPVIRIGEGMWVGITGTVDSYASEHEYPPRIHGNRKVLYVKIDAESKEKWQMSTYSNYKAFYEDTLELDMSKVPIEVSPETYEID